MVTVHSSVCVMPVHTKVPSTDDISPFSGIYFPDTHVYLLCGRKYGSYSDLPSGLPIPPHFCGTPVPPLHTAVSDADLLTFAPRKTHLKEMATSRFNAINVTAIAIIHELSRKCKRFFIFLDISFAIATTDLPPSASSNSIP